MGNGLSTSYGYDGASRLTSLTTSGGGGTAVGLAGYSPAGQVGSRTNSNDAYAWTQGANANRGYTANGLNQYTAITGVSPNPTYDPKGNLTAAGSLAYSYSAENELALAGSYRFYYDAAHRMVYSASAGQRLDHDGAQLAAEYNASGTLTKRYVWGPHADEIMLWYDDNGVGNRRWADVDERGSTTRVSNDAGATLWINSFDDYGVPGAANLGRIQYTGQQWVPELTLYDYKARIYAPSLGRFLQPDPIGYGDGLNWYNYAGSDPVNRSDSTGTQFNDQTTGSLIYQPGNFISGSSSGLSSGSATGSADRFGVMSKTYTVDANGGPNFVGSSYKEYLSYSSNGAFSLQGGFASLVAFGAIDPHNPARNMQQKSQVPVAPPRPKSCQVSNTDSQKAGGVAGAFAYGSEFLRAGAAAARGATAAELFAEGVAGATAATGGTAIVAFVVVGGAAYAYDRYSGGDVTRLFNRVLNPQGCRR